MRLLAVVLIVAGTMLPVLSGPTLASSGPIVATYYGEAHRGLLTASGEAFNPNAYTAAHRTLPLGTRLTVSHEGRSVSVRVNDRGPFTPGLDLDLSQAAAVAIGLDDEGVGEVQVSQANSPVPTTKSPELPRTGGISCC